MGAVVTVRSELVDGTRDGSAGMLNKKGADGAGHAVKGLGCNVCLGTGWAPKFGTEPSPDGNRAMVEDLLQKPYVPFAIVTPTGEWVERGKMGWWGISKQAGTAVARHPAFGDLPHDGYLNELLFRLLGQTVSPNDEALHQIEPLMVGRGSDGYLIHVFQARCGKGKLLASGLKLLLESPEAAYLLDQFVRYARSPVFQPQGTFDANNPGRV